jgi:hypothetical protein
MRERRRILAVVTILVVSQFPTKSVSAISWPIPATFIPANNRSDPQPWLHSNGSNLWCPKTLTGSFGSAFFTQAQSLVNFGGTCNAFWGANAPAGRLRAFASRFNGTMLAQQSTVFSAFNQSAVTASVTHVNSANVAYGSSSTIKDATNSYQFSACFGSCGS